jgi:hypothetical protein
MFYVLSLLMTVALIFLIWGALCFVFRRAFRG